ncbi:RabGAP/TBC [Neocallimastix lanati (nom. inval.)]|uniref:RabGAP/TBC n=1 Tax=Neocallimastix californiae TaxID=1754190 RepID=A0A1Y2FAY5_9FUNG|nr:RabGAP/TBC [Neocallimastix sp. JGI-2020a]ORY81092.1 RabGAP/TBC [Neocallimastix californiae]|eukprot:ORY81092.1 RabGAP/TBC [Neocallimastix californiae]
MDFEQTFNFPTQDNLKNNKNFMRSNLTRKLMKTDSNNNLKSKKNKDLYRKDDDNNLSYGSLTEITEHIYEFSSITENNQEELFDVHLTEENQKHTYSSSSLESIDINSESISEKSEKSNESSDPKYEKLKVDEYGFIINDVFHKKTYNLDSQTNQKKKESSWISMFKNFSLGGWDNSKPKIIEESSCNVCDSPSKLEKFCRDGIPQSFRGYVWSTLADTENIKKKNLFYELCNADALPIDEIILKDITRCYPDHIMFNDKNYYGQHNLFNVLKAYSRYNPSIGYCQGMGFLAGILLMFIPAEDAFWLLVSTIEKYGISGYYTQDLVKLKSDNDIFTKVLKQKLPRIYNHLVDLEIDTILFTTEWFLCLYSKTLPWPCLLRVWDLFYYYGKPTIIKAGIALLQYIEKPLLNRCQDLSKDECLNTTLDIILHIHDYLYTDNYCHCFDKKIPKEENIKVYNKSIAQDIILKSAVLDDDENNVEETKEENNINMGKDDGFVESGYLMPPPKLAHNREHRFKQHPSDHFNSTFYTSISTINNNNIEKDNIDDVKHGKCSSDCICINCFDIETFLNTILSIKISQKLEESLNE